MQEQVLRREQTLRRPVEEVFSFFSRAENLEAITPPFLRFRIEGEIPTEIGTGTLIRYRLRLHGIPIRWLTRIEEWEPPHRFVDRQIKGPYGLWHHTHLFEADGESTRMTDVVRYGQRLGPLGLIAEKLFVRRDIERIFDFRAEEIVRRLETA